MPPPLNPIKQYEYYARRAAERRAAHTNRILRRVGGFFLTLALGLGYALWAVHRSEAIAADPEIQKVEQSVYYRNCAAARAAGAAPINEGQPGYRPELDGDNDGVACEPWPR